MFKEKFIYTIFIYINIISKWFILHFISNIVDIITYTLYNIIFSYFRIKSLDLGDG